MKRSAEERDELAYKRVRQDSPAEDTGPFRRALQRKASDLSANGLDESGFIHARVVMRWPETEGHVRAELGVTEDGSPMRLSVAFTGVCPAFFDSVSLKFEIGDSLQLGLKGASLKIANPTASSRLLLHLDYDNGVRLRFIRKRTPPSVGMVVDFWQEGDRREQAQADRASGDAPLQDDWYSTPVITAGPLNTAKQVDGSELDIPPSENLAPPVSGSNDIAYDRTSSSRAPDLKTTTSSSSVMRNDRRISAPVPKKTDSASSCRASEAPEEKSGSPAITTEPLANSKMTKKAEKAARRKSEKAARQLALLENALGHQDTPSEVARPQKTQQSVPPDFIEGSSRDTGTNKPQKNSLSSVSSVAGRKESPQTRGDSTVKAEVMFPGSISCAALSAGNADGPATNLEAGFPERGGLTYTPLKDLGPGRVCNIIGVVIAQTPPILTRKEEWSTKVTLIDPSNVDEGDLALGFNTTCFTKQRKDNIADVAIGNVLMLRGVMVSDWKDRYNGACPSYKVWSWTLYDPKLGGTKHGGTSATSFNSSFATSAVPTQLSTTELQYCIRLGDWWGTVLQMSEKQLSEAIVIQIGGGGASTSSIPGRGISRQHRLIKDASPSAPPSGYFDCTVEIIHGHRSSDVVYSLYVTDYTVNEDLSAIEAHWCSPSLSNMVLRIETWYAGGNFAETNMKKGDYFLLPNARMKMDANGHLEASVSEYQKFQKLDVDDLTECPHLEALLSRKRQWEEAAEAVGAHEFPHHLFQDANPEQHFLCTVQLLSISKKDDRSYIYVTDYTSRSDLGPVHVSSHIMRYLDSDRIVKIALFDEQAKIAEELESGEFVLLKNLRLRPARAGGEGNLVGKLGGSERLIFKLVPKVSVSVELKELLKRKKAFEEEHRIKQSAGAKPTRRKKAVPELNQGTSSPKRSSAEGVGAPATTGEKASPRPVFIKDLPSCESSLYQFRVIARIISLWPLHIVDCVGMYCRSCKKDIPPAHRICTKCVDDILDDHIVPTFRFFLQLEDKRGDVLQVSVSRYSSLVRNLDACDMREDFEALQEFKDHLAPVLGGLLDDEDRVKHNKGSWTPWLDLVIGSWQNKETGEREYTLLEHALFEAE